MADSTRAARAAIPLTAARIIAVAGPDRRAFLQGQLTQDVARASDQDTVLAGWADAKGRLLWAGHLFARNDAYCLLAPAAMADALLRRLRMFVLRAKVEVTLAELAAVGLIDPASGEKPVHATSDWQDLGLATDVSRRLLVGPGSGLAEIQRTLALPGGADAEWRLRDIRAGIPDVTTAITGAFVPQMANLDLLDGISFAKGCYTGQEIVARTRYLGRVKRRMLRFGLSGAAVPAPGDAVYAARGGVGQVVSATGVADGSELLAIITLDDLPGPLFADPGQARQLRRLPLPYTIPEIAG